MITSFMLTSFAANNVADANNVVETKAEPNYEQSEGTLDSTVSIDSVRSLTVFRDHHRTTTALLTSLQYA